MAFGNIKKDASAAPAAKPEETPPTEKKDGESLGGWNNMWGALAAREGIVSNINPNIYGEVTADGCALMMKNLPPAARVGEDSVVYDLGSGMVCVYVPDVPRCCLSWASLWSVSVQTCPCGSVCMMVHA
jgi:hypothetical protein